MQLLDTAKSFLSGKIKSGDTLVDFTMGNGHDTEYLCSLVPDGKVYAFDIQDGALESTAKLLEAENAPKNYTLIKASHHLVRDYVKEPFCVGMFNLGWLPGGEKSVTTMHQTTIPAITEAIDLLDSGGGILIAVYPGHPEGEIEGELITELLSGYSRFRFTISCLKIVNSPSSPFFFLVEKK